MDSTRTPTPPRAREADIAAATAHLKESWEHGKNAASDAQRIARESWQDLSAASSSTFESRPKTTALWPWARACWWVSSPASS